MVISLEIILDQETGEITIKIDIDQTTETDRSRNKYNQDGRRYQYRPNERRGNYQSNNRQGRYRPNDNYRDNR